MSSPVNMKNIMKINIKTVNCILFILICCKSNNVSGLDIIRKDTATYNQYHSILSRCEYIKIGKEVFHNPLLKKTKKYKSQRGVAIIITIMTGTLGGHRIYLGTKPIVPVVYSLTLGGLCTLPAIDLICLIVVKDISVFEDNDKVFMWLGKN